MKPFRVSSAARSDLDEIWFYIAQDNVEMADRFILGLVSRFPKLAETPQLSAAKKYIVQKVTTLRKTLLDSTADQP